MNIVLIFVISIVCIGLCLKNNNVFICKKDKNIKKIKRTTLILLNSNIQMNQFQKEILKDLRIVLNNIFNKSVCKNIGLKQHEIYDLNIKQNQLTYITYSYNKDLFFIHLVFCKVQYILNDIQCNKTSYYKLWLKGWSLIDEFKDDWFYKAM